VTRNRYPKSHHSQNNWDLGDSSRSHERAGGQKEDWPRDSSRCRAAAQLDQFADVLGERFEIQRAAKRDVRRQQVTVLSLGQLRKSCGFVNRVADNRVLEPPLRTDVSGEPQPGRDSDPDPIPTQASPHRSSHPFGLF
jgi:hypothetical protein